MKVNKDHLVIFFKKITFENQNVKLIILLKHAIWYETLGRLCRIKTHVAIFYIYVLYINLEN